MRLGRRDNGRQPSGRPQDEVHGQSVPAMCRAARGVQVPLVSPFVVRRVPASLPAGSLGSQHGCRPSGTEQFIAAQMACTAADIWDEAYAARKKPDNGVEFTQKRYPTWCNHLHACLENKGPYFAGKEPSYADFALLNAVRVVQFMFPRESLSTTALLRRWQTSMQTRPRLAAFLASR